MIADAPLTGLLGVWEDLVECMHGCNGFGGTACEIYFYRLMGGTSTAREDLERGGLLGQIYSEHCQRACDALLELVRLFEREHEGFRVYPVGPNRALAEVLHLHMRDLPLHRIQLEVERVPPSRGAP